MAVKKTIAIVGAAEKTGTEIARKLATGNYRLLLLSNNITQLNGLSELIKTTTPDTEIEMIDCVKDGCWEADIIILAIEHREQKDIAERIKEVATQKIVACVTDENDTNFIGREMQQLLPYSKVVEVFTEQGSIDMLVTGEDAEAVEDIATMFGKAGYLPIIKASVQ